MGGGHDHHNEIKIPDWRQYKVDGIKELEFLQKQLAARGLKDPWIRNEVWRYHPSNYGGAIKGLAKAFFRSFHWAFLAFAVTVAVDKYVLKKDDSHHGSHHGKDHH
ncbi:hypothetical protein CHS0354_004876 [Potamilus streckersoni]|uniref:NADH dehydrogenase [ubiquinone] 1 beta subcomplex subunit 3 n=1 Tax=Potamilus streckersoni TaxID=2493646 RepID=A0AAE0SIA2_9BIVA|nr:hypothetical protein CHS0354_004876 [Potamilus streckersoni]